MFREIAIVLEAGGAAPRFRLAAADGAAPKVMMVALSDASTEQPIWWLVPAGFTSVQPITIEEVDDADVEGLADLDEVDPLEDLPPSDPRHIQALEQRERESSGILISLPTVTYGEVPPGFRQALPDSGPAPALVHGRDYVLTVMGGGDAGHLPFRRET